MAKTANGWKRELLCIIKKVIIMKKVGIIILCVVFSIIFPFFAQGYLNILFRDLFNPPGWIILQPHLRVISTLLCFAITYGIGYYLLKWAKSKKMAVYSSCYIDFPVVRMLGCIALFNN